MMEARFFGVKETYSGILPIEINSVKIMLDDEVLEVVSSKFTPPKTTSAAGVVGRKITSRTFIF